MDASETLRRLPVHLLALACVAAAVGLGWWQLDAWQARREAAARDLTALSPRPLTVVMGPDDPFPGRDVGRPVTLSGTWLPEGGFVVSDRDDDAGDVGFWAVTPLQVDGADAAVLVVRGWSPSPTVGPPSGTAEITGWLQPPESARPDDDPSDDVATSLRVADAVQRVDVDLWSAYVVTDPARSAGDQRGDLRPASLAALPEVDRFTALRNLLYALEWWFFGGFAVFVWWQWWREQPGRDALADGNLAGEGPEPPPDAG